MNSTARNISMSKTTPTKLTRPFVYDLVDLYEGNKITFLYRINKENEKLQSGCTKKITNESEKNRLLERSKQLALKQAESILNYKASCSAKEHTNAIVKTYSEKGFNVALIHGTDNKIYSVAVYDSEHSKIGIKIALCLLYAFAKANDVWDPVLFDNSKYISEEIGLLLAREIDAIEIKSYINL
jgi:hypothetical protein